jgi:hypothetical protein
MFTDSALQLSVAQALNSTTAASTNVYDVTGAGSGTAPNQIFGNATNFGADIGAGGVLYAWFQVTTAFVLNASTPTLTFQVQAAPASANSAGTYVTLAASAAYSAAAMPIGATLILPVPPAVGVITTNLNVKANALPRFYRFNYLIGTNTFSAGAVNGWLGMTPPTGMVSTMYPVNFASGL